MSKKKQAMKSLHPKVAQLIQGLGLNIKKARMKRRLTMQQVAEAALISRNTLTRLEQGDPSVSFAVIASVLNVLQLEEDIAKLAAPETDELGKALQDDDLMRKTQDAHDRQREGEDDYNF